MNEEQINKLETLHNKIYKETEEYGRTQFVSRIVDLEHNWNELEKCIEDEIKSCENGIEKLSDTKSSIISILQIKKKSYQDILDKMQELEEGGNNDC